MPLFNRTGHFARPQGFVLLSSVLSLVTLSLTAQPGWSQDKQQSPTDPVVKNPVPNQPPKNKQAETPPPAPAVSPESLPSSLTLQEAIGFALRLQPTVEQSIASREQAEERVTTAYSRYYPRITPSYTYLSQYNFGKVTQFVSSAGGGSVVTTNQARNTTTKQAQVGGSMNLFDSGNRELSARQARQSLRAAEYTEANTRQTVMANVADAYFTVLRNETLVRVSQAQVARAQNTFDVITAQVEAKVAAQKDILQAQADLLNAQVNLLQAQNNAATAQANLKQAIGVVGGEPLRLADVVLPDTTTPITASVAPPKSAEANSTTPVQPGNQGFLPGADAGFINRLAETAYQTRPDIAATRQNVEAQRTSSSIARVSTGVQVSGDLAASELIDANKFTSSPGNNRQINVSLSYPLFDGGLVRSQFRASQAGARVAESQLNSQRQQVAVEVETAYRTLAQARATLPASVSALRAARINYEAAIESRKEGVSSIIDVITAQTSLVQAETNYVQAIYNFYAADARLTRAVGQADKISRIGATAPNNPPPVQFTEIPTPPPAPPAANP